MRVPAGFVLVMAALSVAAAANSGDTIVLDRDGRQGAVAFDHAAHVKAPVDPTSRHSATPQATCAGCHHSRDVRGVIQLAKCGGCHGPEGEPRNPKSRDSDEVHRRRALHDRCIGCHVESNRGAAAGNSTSKAPVACADCHKASGRNKG